MENIITDKEGRRFKVVEMANGKKRLVELLPENKLLKPYTPEWHKAQRRKIAESAISSDIGF